MLPSEWRIGCERSGLGDQDGDEDKKAVYIDQAYQQSRHRGVVLSRDPEGFCYYIHSKAYYEKFAK